MDYKKILEQFKNKNIAVFGDVMIDRYIYGHFDHPSAEADIQIIKTDATEELLGGAGSVASMVTGLGAKCRLYCGSIHYRCIKTRIIIDGKQYARYDDDQYHILSDKEYAEHIEAFLKFSFDAVIFSDYNKGYLEEHFVKDIISICRKRGIYIAVDPKPATIERYEGADIIKPNMSEAMQITKCNNVVDCMYAIENDYAHDKSVLITDAGNGMWINGANHIQGINPNVVDVTGCGDMAIAAFTLARVSGADDIIAANIANVAAGMETEQLGCRPISVNNLQKRIDKIIGIN